MANFVSGIISLTLGVVMLATVLIPQVKGTDTSTFSAGEVSLWGVITLISIIGMVYGAGQLFGLL